MRKFLAKNENVLENCENDITELVNRGFGHSAPLHSKRSKSGKSFFKRGFKFWKITKYHKWINFQPLLLILPLEYFLLNVFHNFVLLSLLIISSPPFEITQEPTNKWSNYAFKKKKIKVGLHRYKAVLWAKWG